MAPMMTNSLNKWKIANKKSNPSTRYPLPPIPLIQKIAQVEAQLHHARAEFQIEKDQLQGLAAEHKSTCEKVEHDLDELRLAYDTLDKELDEKHDEIESYKRRLGSEGDEGEVARLEAEIKDLEEEVQQAEIEKRDMRDEIQTLQADSKKLLDKNGAISKERNDERNSLQNVPPTSESINSRKSKNCKFNSARLSRKKSVQSSNSRKRYSVFCRTNKDRSHGRTS
jgi:chromosome segregation ATPase